MTAESAQTDRADDNQQQAPDIDFKKMRLRFEVQVVFALK
jgi:hypothetical protein